MSGIGIERITFSVGTKLKIVDYWKEQYKNNIEWLYDNGFDDNKLENVLDFQIKDKRGTCFACGRIKKLEVVHIVPKVLGGNDEYSNLFLLCNDCHRESPDFKVKKFFLKWVANKKQHSSAKVLNNVFDNAIKSIKKISKNIPVEEFGSERFFKILESIEDSIFQEAMDYAGVHRGVIVDSTRKVTLEYYADRVTDEIIKQYRTHNKP